MDAVSATCPLCETTADVVPEALLLMVVAPDDDERAGWVAWACDFCFDWVAVTVGLRQLAALRLMGAHALAPAEDWSAEAVERRPEEGHLSLDDAIDLHQLLDEPDWFDRLLDMEVAEPPGAGDASSEGC